MPTILPLNEVKARLSEMVGRVSDHHEEIIVTVHGRPAAVLMSIYEYESLVETLDVLGSPDLMAQLSEAGNGDETVSADEVAAALHERISRDNADPAPSSPSLPVSTRRPLIRASKATAAITGRRSADKVVGRAKKGTITRRKSA